MLHTPSNSKDKVLLDAQDRKINYVKSFDDATNIAEIYITASQNKIAVRKLPDNTFEPILVSVIIEGAKIVDKDNTDGT